MKKIAILGLHLSFGGVESAIVNQANALCDNYEVEIVSIYKMSDFPAFKINPKVKITYLTDLKPNRKEFTDALQEKRLLKTFKEGLKSLKILFFKKYKMINYIKKSDADILISSRIEITELLRKYKKKGKITIAEEHVHHNNNNEYINRLKKACQGIDYLVGVSKELTNFYSQNIPGVKSICIANGLDYTPEKLSKLDNKNLISVGRLSPEKGYLDLIDVFYEIYTKDTDFYLDIIGDGNEREVIENKIKKLKLEKNITLHGFQNKDYINKMMTNASLYLMCSFEESFGIVLIEAGSFGVPQIAYDSAQGANELIINNESGYLIKNRNKTEFAAKVIELINNKKRLKNFGKKAHNIALDYSFESTKAKWLDFISKL